MTLSRDCDGCKEMRNCKNRFIAVGKGGFVYCPDGSVHLVDVELEWIKN